MLNKIIKFAINSKLIIGLFIIALIGYGTYQATQLPIDAVPDITNNQVQIITVAPSFGATDIERLVTFPIEQANSNIAGLKEIRSFSRFGLSLVTIVFDDAVDIYWARQQVAERLQKVQNEIPKGIGIPELGPITTGLGEIYQYVVKPKKGFENKYNETDLRTIQDWIVRRQLLGVKGVAEVSSFGGKLKQYSIELMPEKLAAYNITINDVFAALENNNQNTGGAYIEKNASVLYIRTEGLMQKIEDIESIRIKTQTAGNPLFIRDVAKVTTGFATRYGAMCYNDNGEVAGAIVMMLKGANSSQVIKNVKERIEQIQKSLPEGVVIEPFLDRTKMVNNAIGTVEKNLLEGALIVVFVLVVFLGNFRAGFLVASVIPLAMLFAIIMMNWFGVSGNLMSLGALDFGLIVDGAVIIVEAVMHTLHHNKKMGIDAHASQHQMDDMVYKSSSKMMNSAVFGQIIILVVYLPIFTLQGIEGKMFKPMAQTVAFALLGAFILSLTYIPMLSSIFLSKTINHKPSLSDKLMAAIENGYTKILAKILHHPKKIITAVISLFVIAVIVLTTLGGEFIPTLEEGDFAVDTRVLSGSSLSTTIENTQKAAHILKTKFPEVEKVVTKIGSGEVPTDPMPMDAADMMVILKDKHEWTSAKTFNELSEKMNSALQDVPGLSVGFQFPVQMRFNELMTGARQDVVCKIFGENLDSLAKYANALGSIVNTVSGAKNIYVEPIAGLPQIVINYNRNVMAEYGVSVADVNKIINTAFAGQSTGMLYEGEKRFDVTVRLSAQSKKSLEDVKNLLIPTPQGTQVPLYQFASVDIKDGPNQIQREDAKRRIIVGFNISGRDVQSIVSELQQKVSKQIKFSTGYYITYGGAFENLNAAKQRLSIAVPVSLLLILLLLYFAFNSFKYGLLIYSAIPLSAIGGILFLALRGMPFSISAGVGFIALFGVAVLNGIVLVAEFNRIKSDGETNITSVVLKGTQLRLRPVLMTAFVASLGFLPMAISNGAGAEVQRPLATVVIGGLLIATFLTLFVLPILYILFERKSSKMKLSATVKTIVVLIGFFVFSQENIFAQSTITLQQAIDSAIKNNGTVKSERLKAEYQQMLVNTTHNIMPTSITSEVGQFNSIYTDTRFGIAQTLSLPKVYAAQKNLFQQEAKVALLNVKVQEHELKYSIEKTFVQILYLQSKQNLLLKTDSLFSQFLKRTELRFNAGETNVLEKATAQNQLAQVKTQLNQVNADIEILLLELQLLMNTTQKFTPIKSDIKNNIDADTTVASHPLVIATIQQQQVFKAMLAIEKNKLLPDVTFGINNTSIKGTGADDKLYGSSQRFTSAQIGVSVPIFSKAQKNKIKATSFAAQIGENNQALTIQMLRKELNAAFVQKQQYEQTVNYLKTNSLPLVMQAIITANKQFENGAINYLEWVQLMHQNIAVQNEYIDAQKNYNDAVARIHYFTIK